MGAPVPLREGTLVAGKLRVVRVLGAGGMGAVYEVEHELTKHRRALKLLHRDMLSHPTVIARFLREASAAGHIGNGHIVETFDAGHLESGEPYIVMEMLQGETLASRITRHPRMPLPEMVNLFRQACDGVQAAHAAGIVHRDLKPENVFLVERDGKAFVKILDFGISKFDPALTGGPGVTKEGSAIGTPYYMSPEQVNGDLDLDARTDVYALGVMLYECASGERPFEAEALPKLSVLIHQGTPTPLSELRPDLRPDFIDAVGRAMATDRNRRFATPRELAAALGASLDEAALESTQPDPTGPGQKVVVDSGAASVDESQRTRALAPTMAGSAVSIADGTQASTASPKPRGRAAVVATAVVALLAGAAVTVAKLRPDTSRASGAATATMTATVSAGPDPTAPATSTGPSPASIGGDLPLTPPIDASMALPLLPDPSAAPARAPDAGASTKPSLGGSAKPAPASSAVVGPASSSRVDQKGLARDNPFK